MRKRRYTVYILEGFVLLISLVFIIPAWMVVVNSLNTEKDAAFFGISLPQAQLHFDNYIKVFQEANILRAMMNGFFFTAVIGVLAIVFSSMAAFTIVRSKNKVTEFSYFLFIAGIVLPGAVIPTFFLLQKMHLINTYTGVILVLLSFTMPINIFLYTGFIKTVPKELDEAGIIDGCGKLRLFFTIIFPLLKTTTITVFILNFSGVWNDITTQLYFVNSDKWTMPMMVYRFQGMYYSKWNLIFADLFLTSLPIIIVYALGQKYMLSGMTLGSVKG